MTKSSLQVQNGFGSCTKHFICVYEINIIHGFEFWELEQS